MSVQRFNYIDYVKVFMMRNIVLLSLLLASCFAVGAAVALPKSIASEVTIEQVNEHLNVLQTDTNSAASASLQKKDFVIKQYQQALQYLQQQSADKKLIHQDAQFHQNSRRLITELSQKITKKSAADAQLPQNSLALNSQLRSEKANLVSLKNQFEKVSAEKLTALESDHNAKLLEALDKQQEKETEYANRESLEDKFTEQARDTLLKSQLQAANTRVEMRRQALLIQESRLEYLEKQNRWLQQQIEHTQNHIYKIQVAINQLRTHEAAGFVMQAEADAQQTQGAAESLQAFTQQNLRIAQQNATVLSKIELAYQQLEAIRRESRRISRYFTKIKQQLSVEGAKQLPELGAELLRQKQALTYGATVDSKSDAFNDDFALLQLDLLKLEDRLEKLSDEALISGKDRQLPVRAMMQSAITNYREIIEVFTSIRYENTQVQKQINEYRQLLTSSLFWIPSTVPVSWQSFTHLAKAVWVYMQWDLWVKVSEGYGSLTSRINLLGLLFAVIGCALILLKPRLNRFINMQTQDVGKVYRDRFSITLLTLLASLLLALPGSLLIMGAGLLIQVTDAFSYQFRWGLLKAALLLFLLSSLRMLIRKKGLAAIHFGWPEPVLRVMWRNLVIMSVILVPVTFVLEWGDAIPGVPREINRWLTILMSLTFAYCGHRLLRRSSAIPAIGLKNWQNWRLSLSYGLYPIMVFIPLLLIGLSLYGYQYSAAELLNKLMVTAWFLLSAVVFYCFLIRLISILERRMKLERLRALREATRAQKEAQGNEKIPAEVALEQVADPLNEMPSISRQTRAFLGMLAVAVAVAGLWFIWRDIVPALSVFDDTVLWRVTTADSGINGFAITLSAGLQALAVLLITYLGVRNVAGLLEVMLYSSLSMDHGSRYALTTISKYAIVLFGTLVALNLLGARWSNLQWLVAALGVGLGFGLQEIVANFVSGLLLLFERPVRVGDVITVGTHTGTVTRIQIRATTLIDWDRKEQVIPNKTLITENITNWTLSDSVSRRIMKVGIAYGSDVTLAHKTLTQVAEANERILREPAPQVLFLGFGDSSLNFEVRVFVNMADILIVEHELHRDTDAAFREQGIEIPFPQRDLHIRSHFEKQVPDTPMVAPHAD